jgi:hypothetical protein
VAAQDGGEGRPEDPGATRFVIESAPGHDLREDVFVLVRDRQWILLEMQRDAVRLEDVFRQLTTSAEAAGSGGAS